MGFWHWGRGGWCSPGFVTPSSSLTRVNLVWIFTFPCHRFSHFDAVAGVNFDVTRHRAGFQVTTWGCWWRFSRYLEQIFGKLRFHEGNISGGGGERGLIKHLLEAQGNLSMVLKMDEQIIFNYWTIKIQTLRRAQNSRDEMIDGKFTVFKSVREAIELKLFSNCRPHIRLDDVSAFSSNANGWRSKPGQVGPSGSDIILSVPQNWPLSDKPWHI